MRGNHRILGRDDYTPPPALTPEELEFIARCRVAPVHPECTKPLSSHAVYLDDTLIGYVRTRMLGQEWRTPNMHKDVWLTINDWCEGEPTHSRAILKLIEMANKTSNADVLAKNYPKEADDKVYLTCRVHKDGNTFRVEIDSHAPAVWLDETYRQQYGAGGGHLIRNRATGERFAAGGHGLQLLSAGTYLWLGDQLVSLRRDAGAPSYAGALTEPAGRCGELPRQTMLKELNEEIFFASRDGQAGVTILGFTDGHYTEEEVRQIRNNQISQKQIGDHVPVEIVKLEAHTPDALAMSTAEIWLDGKMVDRIDGPHFFDEENQTLEVRQSYLMPNGYTIEAILDGEAYDREVVIKSLIQLAADQETMTPCLENATKQAMAKFDSDMAACFDREEPDPAKTHMSGPA